MNTENLKETELGLILTDWDLEELNSLCKITSSKRIFHKEYVDKGIPFYRSKEIILRANNSPIKDPLYISEDKYCDILNKYGVPNEGDLLMTSVGTLGIPYIVQPDDKFYFKDGNLMWFRSFSKRLYNKYLYYWVLSPAFQQKLDTVSIGSTQKALTINSLKKIEIPIPPFDEQIEIVKILSDLDSKIILNQKMNQTLEEIGQALFKHWFVHFEFPNEEGKPYKSSGGEMVDSELGEIPKGWEIKSLDRIANYLNGLALQKFPPEKDDYLPVIKIRELKQGVTAASDKASSKIDPNYIIDDGDVIFSWSGSLEVVLWCGGKGALNQHLFKVSSEEYPKWFYYYWTKYHLETFRQTAADKTTTMGHIKRKDLSDALVVVPSNEIFSKFNKIMAPLIDLIINNNIESRNLSKTRDSILPKLMSGKIRVPLEEK